MKIKSEKKMNFQEEEIKKMFKSGFSAIQNKDKENSVIMTLPFNQEMLKVN